MIRRTSTTPPDDTTDTAVIDSGATSNFWKTGDSLILTGRPSTKVVSMPTGATVTGSEQGLMHYNLRSPARAVDIIPALKHNSLISVPKLSQAQYITVFDGDEVNVYDGHTTKIHVTNEAVMAGWLCKKTNLYRIPLKPNMKTSTQTPFLSTGPNPTTASTTSTNFPLLNAPSGTSMRPQDSRPRKHGWREYEITSSQHGPESPSKR